MSLSRGSSPGPRYPMYKSQQLLYARWAEDGLYYKAKVTDLLPETQSYLVVFVDYGNSQVCTAADLMPLDSAVMIKAAPPPLATDATVLEAQRLARIEERRLALKAEEDARKAVLDEKRRIVTERRNARERLEREEQLEAVEAQRARLTPPPGTSAAAAPKPAPVPAPVAVVAPVPVVAAAAVTVTSSAVPALVVATPARVEPVVAATATPAKPAEAARASQAAAAVESTPRSAAKERKRDETRRTLAVVGSGGGKISLAEMRREALLLTPTNKAAASDGHATPAVETACATTPKPVDVEETRREDTRRPLLFGPPEVSDSAAAVVTVEPLAPLELAEPPLAVAATVVAPPQLVTQPALTPQQREKQLAAEALEKVRTMREQKQQRALSGPVVAAVPAATAAASATSAATTSKTTTSSTTALPIPSLHAKGKTSHKGSRGAAARGGGSEDEEEESSSGSEDDGVYAERSLALNVDGNMCRECVFCVCCNADFVADVNCDRHTDEPPIDNHTNTEPTRRLARR